MAISYEDALATLQSMFSDQGYTVDQLDAVLRHEGGHMEHTVQVLLNHGDESPDALIQKLPTLPTGGGGGGDGSLGNSRSNNVVNSIDTDEQFARQLAAEFERQTTTATTTTGSARTGSSDREREVSRGTNGPAFRDGRSPAATTKGRGLSTVLPPEFLRIPGRTYPSTTTSSSTTNNHRANSAFPNTDMPDQQARMMMMTDEQLARMLQDELFQEELRNNPEFSHLAGRRNPRAHNNNYSAGSSGQMTGRSTYGAGGGGGGGGGGTGERNEFFDRLSDLGETAKRRLEDLAASWRDSNRLTRPFFNGAAAGSNTQPVRTERRGLLLNDLDLDDDDDEEEMNFVGGSRNNNSGRDFEMNDIGGGDKKKD